jgi:hypothetical protein
MAESRDECLHNRAKRSLRKQNGDNRDPAEYYSLAACDVRQQVSEEQL